MRRHGRQRPTRSPKLAVGEALAVLRRLAQSAATLEELLEVAGVSRATLFRLLADLQQLGVRVEHDESLSAYRVADWGVLSLRRLRAG